MTRQGMPRLEKTRQHETRQDNNESKARHDETRQDNNDNENDNNKTITITIITTQ